MIKSTISYVCLMFMFNTCALYYVMCMFFCCFLCFCFLFAIAKVCYFSTTRLFISFSVMSLSCLLFRCYEWSKRNEINQLNICCLCVCFFLLLSSGCKHRKQITTTNPTHLVNWWREISWTTATAYNQIDFHSSNKPFSFIHKKPIYEQTNIGVETQRA